MAVDRVENVRMHAFVSEQRALGDEDAVDRTALRNVQRGGLDRVGFDAKSGEFGENVVVFVGGNHLQHPQ